MLEFSPNTIKLEATGPDHANLSFFDLPGIINQTEDSARPWLVEMVKRLTEEYISEENALILLACSMEGDIANSTASRIVRENGAEDRCIGKSIQW